MTHQIPRALVFQPHGALPPSLHTPPFGARPLTQGRPGPQCSSRTHEAPMAPPHSPALAPAVTRQTSPSVQSAVSTQGPPASLSGAHALGAPLEPAHTRWSVPAGELRTPDPVWLGSAAVRGSGRADPLQPGDRAADTLQDRGGVSGRGSGARGAGWRPVGRLVPAGPIGPDAAGAIALDAGLGAGRGPSRPASICRRCDSHVALGSAVRPIARRPERNCTEQHSADRPARRASRILHLRHLVGPAPRFRPRGPVQRSRQRPAA